MFVSQLKWWCTDRWRGPEFTADRCAAFCLWGNAQGLQHTHFIIGTKFLKNIFKKASEAFVDLLLDDQRILITISSHHPLHVILPAKLSLRPVKTMLVSNESHDEVEFLSNTGVSATWHSDYIATFRRKRGLCSDIRFSYRAATVTVLS